MERPPNNSQSNLPPFNPQGQFPPQGYSQQFPQQGNPQQSYPQQPYNGPQQGYPQQPYQPPPYGQPMPPPKKKRGRLALIIGGVIALLLFACIGTNAVMSSHGTATTATTGGTSDATQASNSTQAPTAKWTTTHTFKGTGSKKTESFQVGNDWKIVWTCDASSFGGNQYNVAIIPTGTDNTPIDSGVNTMCKTGNTHDETEQHQGGNVFLDVISEGDWTVQVQELK